MIALFSYDRRPVDSRAKLALVVVRDVKIADYIDWRAKVALLKMADRTSARDHAIAVREAELLPVLNFNVSIDGWRAR